MPEVLTPNIEAKAGYKHTKLGWIPEEWDIKALSELMSFRNGANADKSDYGQGIRFINVLEVLNNTFITPEAIHGRVTLEGNEIERNLVKSGDILFNRTSETPEDIGMTAVYLGDEPVVFGGFVIKGSSLNHTLDTGFKGYCFNASLLRKQIIARGQGAVRSNIGQKDLEKVLLPIPPFPEQRKIAEILSAWDAVMAKMEDLIAQKQQLKKGLMQQLLTGKKRFVEFVKSTETKTTKLGWIPEEWNYLTMETISDKIMVGIASAATHAYRKKGVILLRNLNIKENGIDRGDLLYIDRDYEFAHKNKRLRERDIITVRTGYPGISSVVTSDLEDAQCFTSLITRPNKGVIDSQYLCYFINSPKGRTLMLSGEAGGAQKNINAKVLAKLKVPVPSLPEQQKIASVLSEADVEIESLNQHLVQLKAQKKGLMQKLLTGAVRVKID